MLDAQACVVDQACIVDVIVNGDLEGELVAIETLHIESISGQCKQRALHGSIRKIQVLCVLFGSNVPVTAAPVWLPLGCLKTKLETSSEPL